MVVVDDGQGVIVRSNVLIVGKVVWVFGGVIGTIGRVTGTFGTFGGVTGTFSTFGGVTGTFGTFG